jgi:serine/threonine-protein kinase
MAHVWLGRFKGKHGFEKLVAIKTILPEHALDAHFRNMFLDEARIASGVEHPNVAHILDLGEWRDCLYLVMEYVDGDSLSRLRRSVEKQGMKLPVQLTLRIFADMCAGLHAAHELKADDGTPLAVVHRDVSPQNLLIPVNGVPKVIDFGVAKARQRLGSETSAGFAKGKSRYMSPEQALAKAVDRRADVFAMGAMLYEVVEGHAPYDGPNDMARLHALITGEEIRAVPQAPHPSIEKVVVKALARDPDQRFATAGEMRAAIEDAMVAMKARASAEDIGAFVTEHTADRIAERKRVVKLALDGAIERQRIKDMVEHETVAKQKNDSSPAFSPAPNESGPELPIVESAPPAYSASVGDHAPLVVPIKRRRWMIAVGGGMLLTAVVVGGLAMRAHRLSGQPTTTATSGTVATTQASSVVQNIPPPPTTPEVQATLQERPDAAAPRVLATHPHATSIPTTRHAKNPHDVVIQ